MRALPGNPPCASRHGGAAACRRRAAVTGLALLAAASIGAVAPAEASGAYSVVATISVGYFPVAVAVDPATGTADVAKISPAIVSLIDTATNKVTDTLPVGNDPDAVAVDPATHTAYVTGGRYGESGTVSVIDEATRRVRATIPVGQDPFDVAVDSLTQTVYVANQTDGTVSVIDAATDTVAATVPVAPLVLGVAADPATHTVYVTSNAVNDESGTVSVVDEADNTVTATIPVGANSLGAAVDPATHTVYVISEGVDTNNNGTVSVINGATDKVTAVIPVGRAPMAVAVDPAARTVYVVNAYVSGGSSGSVSVIDEATNKVTATVLIGDGASGVAVDPVTHAAYVTSPNGGTVSVIGGGQAPANCMPGVGACGYPDAASTGVPTGTTLKTVPGQVSSGPGWHFDKRGFVQVNGDGAVLKDLRIPYNVNITASHVTLQDDQITPRSYIGVTLRHTSGDVIEDSTISGHPTTGGALAAGIKDIYGDSTGLQVLRDDFAGTSVAVQVNAGLIADNYIHPPASGGSAHAAGIVSNGGNTASLAIEHNTVLVGASHAYAIGLFADFGPQANRLIDNNLLAGGNYALYGGGAAGRNIQVTANRFSRVYYPKGGFYGPAAHYALHGPGNASYANFWDNTLTPVPAP